MLFHTLLFPGFLNFQSDYSMFMKLEPSPMIVLVYVDDILVTSPNASLYQDFIEQLSSLFLVKHLGPLHYFLGLQVQRPTESVFFSQKKYAWIFLLRHTWKVVNIVLVLLVPINWITLALYCLIQRNIDQK